MNIWLIMSGEPLEQFGERPHRVGTFSKLLVENGHEVTWWTTTYDHQYKKYLYNQDTQMQNDFGVNMVFLHSTTPYKKNISFDRIKNHQEVSSRFSSVADKKEKPDVIFCAFPTIELAYQAVKYGQNYNVPVVIDVRDLWPDIFLNPFPKILQPLIKIFLSKYIRETRYIFKHSTAIAAVSKKYLEFGLDYGYRKLSDFDRVFPLAYNKTSLSKNIYTECEKQFNKIGIDKEKTIIWFVGTFGQTYDLTTVIKVARELSDREDIQFVFTGDGEKSKEWKELAKGLPTIKFTGWVNQDQLAYLADIADIGLMAYRKGAPQGLPNKIFEYCAYGMPILSSLQSETRELLEAEEIGFTYDADMTQSFKECLIKLIDKPQLIETMSKNAYQLYKDRFSAKKVYGSMMRYLEELVKEKRDV